MSNTKTDLRPVLHNACSRIGNCTGAVSMAIDGLVGGHADMKDYAVGALVLALAELVRLQEELDRAWVKSAYVVEREEPEREEPE